MSKTLLSFNLEPQNCETIQVVYLILFLWNNVFAKVEIGAHSVFWTIINRYWFWSVKTLKEKNANDYSSARKQKKISTLFENLL